METPLTGLSSVSDGDIEQAFAPFVVERFPLGDPWLANEERRLEDKYSRPRNRPTWTNDDGQRTTDTVKSGYETTWSDVSLAKELADSKVIPFEWRGQGMRARTIGRKRLHQLYLVRALEWLKPHSVLEVGFGYGFNLLLLSMQFPDMQFSGVELTNNGLDKAKTLAGDAGTAAMLAPFATRTVWDADAPRRLTLRTGSADALPIADKSVDMAITVLALEQMERIRDRAIAELTRVARRHVIMVEPFRDWNADGHRRKYIERYDYFAASIGELASHGLTPIVATADMPNKVTFRAGVVIAAVS
jgi:ubiquinone/menaquinone biosynthesis C-methylase UbiE